MYIQKIRRKFILMPGLSDLEVFRVIGKISHDFNTTVSFYNNTTTNTSLNTTLLLCLVIHLLLPNHVFLT